jgi:hypothetical protein
MEARTLDDMAVDSNHRFEKSNSPDFSVGFDRARRWVAMRTDARYHSTSALTISGAADPAWIG